MESVKRTDVHNVSVTFGFGFSASVIGGVLVKIWWHFPGSVICIEVSWVSYVWSLAGRWRGGLVNTHTDTNILICILNYKNFKTVKMSSFIHPI